MVKCTSCTLSNDLPFVQCHRHSALSECYFAPPKSFRASRHLSNTETGSICTRGTDRWEHSVAWLQERLQRGSSPPLFSLTHYPGGSVLGSSVRSPAAANKPTGEINQRGGGPVSAGATNAHLFR